MCAYAKRYFEVHLNPTLGKSSLLYHRQQPPATLEFYPHLNIRMCESCQLPNQHCNTHSPARAPQATFPDMPIMSLKHLPGVGQTQTADDDIHNQPKHAAKARTSFSGALPIMCSGFHTPCSTCLVTVEIKS